jgi:D-sedoheptulose 7-phosphate isomerase
MAFLVESAIAKSYGLESYLEESASVLVSPDMSKLGETLERAVEHLADSLKHGRPLLVCGNGGSAADAMHITGELVGRFLRERQALRCYCISSNSCVLTAWSNDHSFETAFARQVEAYGEPGGTLLGLSTSGQSPNVIAAFETAIDIGMTTIAFTGEQGGQLANLADYLLNVPSQSIPVIQQAHICLYHYLCAQLERKCMK